LITKVFKKYGDFSEKGVMIMHLSQLELLCEIARVKSFSKAAKLLHLSQPAVSGQIHSIEDFYGAQLFERSSTGVALTKIGEVVNKYANEILRLHDNLEKEIDSLQQSENQKLVIGASSIIGNYALPCSIWHFKEKYPLVQMKLEIKNAETILSMLINEQINLALLEEQYLPKSLDNLCTQRISDDELLVIAPPKKPWVNRESITLEELKKAPLIIREKGSGIRQIFENILHSWGLSLDQFNVKTEMGSIDAIKSTVEAGLGLSICSRIAVRKEIRNGTIHPLTIDEKSIKINYLIIYKIDKKLNSAAKRFIRLLAGPGQIEFC